MQFLVLLDSVKIPHDLFDPGIFCNSTLHPRQTRYRTKDQRPVYDKETNNVSRLLMLSSNQTWMGCGIKWDFSVDRWHFARKRGFQV